MLVCMSVLLVYWYVGYEQHGFLSTDIYRKLQWKNDLGLYFTLVLVMKIGMCDLMIIRLV